MLYQDLGFDHALHPQAQNPDPNSRYQNRITATEERATNEAAAFQSAIETRKERIASLEATAVEGERQLSEAEGKLSEADAKLSEEERKTAEAQVSIQTTTRLL